VILFEEAAGRASVDLAGGRTNNKHEKKIVWMRNKKVE
jgi:hypothetical protein